MWPSTRRAAKRNYERRSVDAASPLRARPLLRPTQGLRVAMTGEIGPHLKRWEIGFPSKPTSSARVFVASTSRSHNDPVVVVFALVGLDSKHLFHFADKLHFPFSVGVNQIVGLRGVA